MTESKKFRLKAPLIEAVQWTGANTEHVEKFLGRQNLEVMDAYVIGGRALIIFSPKGNRMARPNDWVVKGLKGEFYSVTPDVFNESYEEVSE